MREAETKADLVARYVGLGPVVPVVTIDDPEAGPALALTLVEAGLPVVEVTLRTPRALAAMEAIARDVPEAVVAAGTVVAPEQVASAERAGAKLLVTPGTSPAMARALAASRLPAMPAAATVSESLALAEHGFLIQKLFPAAALGGPAWLRAVAAPLPQVRFCPTGGIDLATAPAYLALDNVACIGGSWMVPKAALAARDWPAIARLAAEAAALRPA